MKLPSANAGVESGVDIAFDAASPTASVVSSPAPAAQSPLLPSSLTREASPVSHPFRASCVIAGFALAGLLCSWAVLDSSDHAIAFFHWQNREAALDSFGNPTPGTDVTVSPVNRIAATIAGAHVAAIALPQSAPLAGREAGALRPASQIPPSAPPRIVKAPSLPPTILQSVNSLPRANAPAGAAAVANAGRTASKASKAPSIRILHQPGPTTPARSTASAGKSNGKGVRAPATRTTTSQQAARSSQCATRSTDAIATSAERLTGLGGKGFSQECRLPASRGAAVRLITGFAFSPRVNGFQGGNAMTGRFGGGAGRSARH